MSKVTPDTRQMRSLMSGSSGRNFTQSSPRTRKRNPNPARISAVIIMARVSTSFTAGQKQIILAREEWPCGWVMGSGPVGTLFPGVKLSPASPGSNTQLRKERWLQYMSTPNYLLFLSPCSSLRSPHCSWKYLYLLRTGVLSEDGVVLIASLDPIKNICDTFPPQATAFCTHLQVKRRKKDHKLLYPPTQQTGS